MKYISIILMSLFLLGNAIADEYSMKSIGKNKFKSMIINNEKLTIPHSRIQERLFVLKPWTDIEPNYKLPQLNKTISYLISQFDMNSNVIRLYGKSL